MYSTSVHPDVLGCQKLTLQTAPLVPLVTIAFGNFKIYLLLVCFIFSTICSAFKLLYYSTGTYKLKITKKTLKGLTASKLNFRKALSDLHFLLKCLKVSTIKKITMTKSSKNIFSVYRFIFSIYLLYSMV